VLKRATAEAVEEVKQSAGPCSCHLRPRPEKRVNGLRVSGQEEAAEEVGQKLGLTSCARCRASHKELPVGAELNF